MSKRIVNGYFSSVPLAQLMIMAEGVPPEDEAPEGEENTTGVEG